ncbi:MAG: type II toxin-antitoxin system HicA family toxin [Chloroflexi bacterium]|nr:type II toxin-antitoxin system HicA family toxin [Chloroflexota bacterium]
MLTRHGALMYMEGSRHEVWGVPGTTFRTIVPRHKGEIPTGTVQKILKDLHIQQDE